MEDDFAARLQDADDQIAALTRERDALADDLASATKGGDASSAETAEARAKLSRARNDLDASKREVSELEALVRKLTLAAKDAERDAIRAANRATFQEENNRANAATAAAEASTLTDEIASMKRRLADERAIATAELVSLRTQLAAATKAAEENIGREAQSVVDAAEARATAATREAEALRAEIVKTRNAADVDVDDARREASAAEARARRAEEAARGLDGDGGGADAIAVAVAAVARQLDAAVAARGADAEAFEEERARARANVAVAETATRNARDDADAATTRAVAAEARARALRERLEDAMEDLGDARRELEGARSASLVARKEAVGVSEKATAAAAEAASTRAALRDARASIAALEGEVARWREAAERERARAALSEARAADADAAREERGGGGASRERGDIVVAVAVAPPAQAPPMPMPSPSPSPSPGGFDVASLIAANRMDGGGGDAPWLTEKEKRLVSREREKTAAAVTEVRRDIPAFLSFERSLDRRDARLSTTDRRPPPNHSPPSGDGERGGEDVGRGARRVGPPRAARRDRGASHTLVPIRPRWRGERRSLRTFAVVSLRPHLAFNPRHRRLSTPTDAFQLHPDFRSYGTTLSARSRPAPEGTESTRASATRWTR